MKDKFNNWNNLKQEINLLNKETIPYFREGQVWFICMGINVGFEQNGKSEDFKRPVLILKKFNKDMFLGIPLTKTKREGKFYFELDIVKNFKSYAILSQIKMYSSKRLLSHVGGTSLETLKNVKKKINKLIE